jgi:FAD/FMN-containing dehydrogenase
MAEPDTHAALPAFAVPSGLAGRVVVPGDERYEAARQVQNPAIDRRPIAVVLARDVDDVVATLALARDVGSTVAIRGGGHSAAGHGTADDAIVLDTSAMHGVAVDDDGATAWVRAGTLAGELTASAHEVGCAVPLGDWATVGVVGLTLGGGIGWLVRLHGLTVDSLLAAELVTAAGERLTASAEENPDLFWALRGGGGNFGVVTRLRFRLHRVDTVLAGHVILPAEPDVLRRLVATLADAPDGLTAMPTIMPAPPMPAIPERLHGRLVAYVPFAHAGPVGDDPLALDVLRSIGPVIAQEAARKPYPELFPRPSGERAAAAAGNLFVDELDDRAIEIITLRLANASSRRALVNLRVLGGAAARIPNDATAFAHRDRRAAAWLITPFEDPAEAARHEAWTADFEAELREAGCGSGAFVNFTGGDGEHGTAAVEAAYPPATRARLAEVKRRYDPDNVFRSNVNVAPAAGSSRTRAGRPRKAP